MSTNNLSTPASGRFSLSAAALHILAMVLMLMDHLWATLLPAQDWLTCAGRLAFPIFAFMAVEGYFHTHSFRKYALRLALFAVLSEVPFDLMYGGTWFYPVHQNVIWTLLLGLLGIHLMETVRKKQKTWLYLLTALLVVLIGTVLGPLSMVDYYGTGVLTIFIFYFFRGRKWWCLAGQLLALYWSMCSCWAVCCIPSIYSAWNLRSVSRGLHFWRSSPSGCTADGRAITANRSSMPAMPFIPYIC